MLKWGGGILTSCVIAELVCNITHVSEEFWRLTCFRYLFLIYLGILWCKNGLRMNGARLCLALISILFINLFKYSDIDWYPIFIENAWKQCRWTNYFYVAFAIPTLLWWLYNIFSTKLKHFVELLGRYSYEIFLCQMVVFCLPRKVFLSHLGETGGSLTFIILTLTLSIVPVLMYKQIHFK